MASAFDQFCKDTQKALKNHKGPQGRKMVQLLLEKLLNSPEFLEAECGSDAATGIRTIYRDKETGFNVLVHVYQDGKKALLMTTDIVGQFMGRHQNGLI